MGDAKTATLIFQTQLTKLVNNKMWNNNIVVVPTNILCRESSTRLIAILLLTHICVKIIAIYYIKIIHLWLQPHMVQWSSTASDEAILTNGPGFESGDSQLEFDVRHVPIVLFL